MHAQGRPMPYRTLPPYRRPWWEICTGLWMLCLVAGGAYGLLYPTREIAAVLGAAQVIYSVASIAFGIVAFVAWWFGQRDPERIAMLTLAGLSFVHGIGVWIAIGDTAAQTGLRIVAAAIGTIAWVELRHAFGMTRKAVEEAVRVIGDNEPPESG